jgi:hypothetical protein
MEGVRLGAYKFIIDKRISPIVKAHKKKVF